MRYTIAYFGSPSFSAQLLERLITDTSLPIEISAVFTQPDKPVGRKQIMTPTPVKEIANKYGIKIINQKEMLHVTRYTLHNFDLAIVYAYSHIISPNLLNQPKYGFINIHPSLLPRYRGPSPITYPIIAGDTETGVTIIQMDEKIDHGPIIAQEKLIIGPAIRRSELEIQLTDLGFNMLKRLLKSENVFFERLERCATASDAGARSQSEKNDIESFVPQNDQDATYTRLLTKQDGFIPLFTLKKALNNEPLTFEELSKIIKDYLEKYQKEFFKKTFNFSLLTFNLFRALYPWPGIWTFVTFNNQQKRLKITDMDFINGKLIIKKLQLEGKKEVDFKTFNRAYHMS